MANAQLNAIEARQQRQDDFQRMKEWREEDRQREIEREKQMALLANQNLRLTVVIGAGSIVAAIISGIVSGPVMEWLKAWLL